MFRRILSLIVLAAAMGFAQFAPEPQVADIKLMMDPKTEQPMKMDFSTHLSGISDPGILFAHFSNRPLLIYYFSPKCPHCQKHFPEIQNLIKEYESKGLTGIAIGLNGSTSTTLLFRYSRTRIVSLGRLMARVTSRWSTSCRRTARSTATKHSTKRT